MSILPVSAYEKLYPPGPQVQQMTQVIADLDRTWVTTGFYTWQEMGEIVAATVQMAGAASSAAISFWGGTSTSDMKDYVRAAQTRYSEVSKRALDYTEIWQKAKATGVVINAPGLRKWVIDDLRAALALMRAVEVAAHAAPWWLSAVTGFFGFFVNVANIAVRIGKIVVKAGAAVLDAADTVFGLWPVIKWGAIAVGAAFVGMFTWGKLSRMYKALPRG